MVIPGQQDGLPKFFSQFRQAFTLSPPPVRPVFADFLFDPWVESTLAQLSPRQQMAQLLHLAGWSNRGPEHENELLQLIEAHGIGGIIFFQGTPERQLDLTRRYQAASQVPLLISIDAEWGLGMRLDNSLSFPHQIALGAVKNDQLLYDMGRDLGQQCRRMGIHMNFAPCVDVNVEPANPVIGFRSFGQDPALVIRKARAYMEGLQDAGVLAVAKHFPGHGDTAVDSHFDLPTLSQSVERMANVEWPPFEALIKAGVAAVMPGHLRVPALDDRPNIGATLSEPVVTQLLRGRFDFEGLVVTDALDMKGVTKHHPPGEIELMAFQAGSDILLFPSDVRIALLRLERALERGEIDLGQLRARCRRVLAAKRWADAHTDPVPTSVRLHEDLHRPESVALIQDLHAASLAWGERSTIFPERGKLLACQLPLGGADELKHHQLSKGLGSGLPLAESLAARGWEVEVFRVGAEEKSLPPVPEGPWVLSLHGFQVKARDKFGMGEEAIEQINRLLASGPSAVLLFGSPFILRHLTGWEDLPLIHAFQGAASAQHAVAAVVLGLAEVRGTLSVSWD